MKSVWKSILLGGALLLAGSRAEALPLLQLDILSGHYDPSTKTIISGGPDFTLVALLTPREGQNLTTLLNDTYFISTAVVPQSGPSDTSLGSYTWNGTPYRVTEDMTYGTPPLEATDGGNTDFLDMQSHHIFPTFFNEFSFQFSEENRTVSYYSPHDPGGLTPTSSTTGVSYFQTFNITTSLSGPNVLHFDLYNTYIQNCFKHGTCAMDEDIAAFAPFDTDAQSSNAKVAEPGSLLLMSAGLFLANRFVRRRRAA